MKAIKTFLILVVLLTSVSFGSTEEKKLRVTFDLTYMSKYMSKGSESYGQQGALFETIYLDFWGSGFGASVRHRNATSSGYVDKQRFDYRVFYSNKLFEGQSYETKYKASWGYEHYYGLARNKANTTQEWNFTFSWPELLPGGIVPKYAVCYECPAGSKYRRHDVSGWVHLFGLGYDLNVSKLPNPLHLSADISYRDGLGGSAKDRDWSHATLGISTKFKISKDMTFVPGIYQQLSMDDSVCKKDVTYCKLSMKYKF